MKLKIHKDLREIMEIEATRVLVEDDLGNPIAFALQYGPGMIIAATADDPNFNAMLQQMGINKVVAITDVDVKSLESIRFGV